MNLKSKIFVLFTIFALLLGVSACGGDDSNENDSNQGDKIEVYFDDRVVEYNGEMYQLEIDGKLPSDISVRYEYINLETGEIVSDKGVIEPGEYEVRVFFEGDIGKYGLPPDMIAHLIIKGEGKPAEVWFEGMELKYDGMPHSIFVQGYFPSDVKVRYEYYDEHGNFVSEHEVIEPGYYNVAAYFEGNFEKYGLPPQLDAWIHILEDKPSYDINVLYDDIIWCIERDGQLNYEITGELPEDVWVEYENNSPQGVGVHTARAYFHGERDRYNLPEFLEANITIFEEIRFVNQTVAYDGYTHNIFIESYIPEDVWVEYDNNTYSEPGEYFVTAHIW